MIKMKTEDKKKLWNKIFSKIFLALLIAFLALYLSEKTGYYEYEQHKQVTLTKEKIKQFEEDVAAGKNIDIKDYTTEETINYETKISQAGLNISKNVGKIVKTGLEGTFNFLNEIMEGK